MASGTRVLNTLQTIRKWLLPGLHYLQLFPRSLDETYEQILFNIDEDYIREICPGLIDIGPKVASMT